MRRTRFAVAVAVLVAGWIVLLSDLAVADHLIVQVTGPEQAELGEPVDIVATVRRASDGVPAAGAVVVFSSDAEFAGVEGSIERGRVTTNELGVADFRHAFTELRTHTVRVEILDDPTAEPESVSFPVVVGRQLHTSQAGIRIPGVGGWLVTLVIAGVWAIMIAAFAWVVGLSRQAPSPVDEEAGVPGAESPRPRSALNLAIAAFVVMNAFAIGLVVMLVRSPDTHSNLNPEGYLRTAVAYVAASYDYPGTGLSPEALQREGVVGGQTLFLSRGCAGCHGLNAEGTAAAESPTQASREWLETVVRSGIAGLMPSYSQAELGVSDLDRIYAFLVAERSFAEPPAAAATTPTTSTNNTSVTTTTATSTPGPPDVVPTFAVDIVPIMRASCTLCHGSAGGWTASDYESVMNTGDHEPVIVPGDPDASLLIHKITGEQAEGAAMPPGDRLSDADIRTIIDWVSGGAPP